MPNKIVDALMQEVATLREQVAVLTTDIRWIKAGIYVSVVASISAFFGVIGQIVMHVVIK